MGNLLLMMLAVIAVGTVAVWIAVRVVLWVDRGEK